MKIKNLVLASVVLGVAVASCGKKDDNNQPAPQKQDQQKQDDKKDDTKTNVPADLAGVYFKVDSVDATTTLETLTAYNKDLADAKQAQTQLQNDYAPLKPFVDAAKKAQDAVDAIEGKAAVDNTPAIIGTLPTALQAKNDLQKKLTNAGNNLQTAQAGTDADKIARAQKAYDTALGKYNDAVTAYNAEVTKDNAATTANTKAQAELANANLASEQTSDVLSSKLKDADTKVKEAQAKVDAFGPIITGAIYQISDSGIVTTCSNTANEGEKPSYKVVQSDALSEIAQFDANTKVVKFVVPGALNPVKIFQYTPSSTTSSTVLKLVDQDKKAADQTTTNTIYQNKNNLPSTDISSIANNLNAYVNACGFSASK